MTPLRQRMLDDMQLRGFVPNTQRAYVQAVQQFAQHYGKSPDQHHRGRTAPVLPLSPQRETRLAQHRHRRLVRDQVLV